MLCCMLKLETCRELKDRLGKAATAAEYKLYEREQEVRRQLDAELGRWRGDYATTHSELIDLKDTLQQVRAFACCWDRGGEVAHA